MKRIIILIIVICLLVPCLGQAAMIDTVRGKILLQVQEHGEAWYVYPVNNSRYYLQDGEAAYQLMRNFGLGIADIDLNKIPAVKDTAEMKNKASSCGVNSLANKLKGKILLQVQQHGEAWYIYPLNCNRIYMADGQSAYDIMRYLGLGITNQNLSLIPVAKTSALVVNSAPKTSTADSASGYGKYEKKYIQTANGSFQIDVVEINLAEPGLQVVTDTANQQDCANNCLRKTLKDYVTNQSGFAGIHGSYFCTQDYSACSGKTNSYYFPFYNTLSKVLINADQVQWLQGAILVFDSNNKPYFFPDGKQFKSLADFETKYGVKVQAVISNFPALVDKGVNIVNSQYMDSGQENTKGSRGGIGIKDQTVYLIIAHNATVPDLASIMEALAVDTALNLDGGGSCNLYFDGNYKVGPNRQLPNAIIFKK